MPYIARLRHAPTSARKARLIADMIRGKYLNEALVILRYAPQRAAKLIYKLLRSAQANAEDQGARDVDDLYISKIWADDGITFKRYRPKARGRVAPILHRRCHINIELEGRAE